MVNGWIAQQDVDALERDPARAARQGFLVNSRRIKHLANCVLEPDFLASIF